MKSFEIVTGEKGEGKTTLIEKLALGEQNAWGFVSIHRGDEYYLKDLRTREETLLMTPRPLFSSFWKVWSVNEALFDSVYSSLSSLTSGKVFLDECGRMEMDGKGFDRTLRMLMERDVDICITLRRPFIPSFVSHYSIVDYRLITLERRA